MRRAATAFAVVFAAGMAALAATALTRGSDVAYSTSALISAPVVQLRSNDLACQGPYRLPSSTTFNKVAFTLGTYERAGPPLEVVIREAHSGRRVAIGRLPGGYPDITRAPQHVVRVPRVASHGPLEVCFVHRRGPRVAIYGQPDIASPHATATLNGKPTGADMAVTLRTQERSLLALLPDMTERAARFRAGWVTPVVYAILAALLLVGAPLVLARGVARAAEDSA